MSGPATVSVRVRPRLSSWGWYFGKVVAGWVKWDWLWWVCALNQIRCFELKVGGKPWKRVTLPMPDTKGE